MNNLKRGALSVVLLAILSFATIHCPKSFASDSRDEIGDRAADLINKTIAVSSNGATVDQLLSQIKGLPHRQPGNVVEATRLNKEGLEYLTTKNFLRAVDAFKFASEVDPADSKLFSNLGYAELHADSLQQAQKHLYESLTLDAMRPVTWGNLGEVFARSGQREKAISCFLVGYRVSGGKTSDYLRWLNKDPNRAVQQAGTEALRRVQSLAVSAAEIDKSKQPSPESKTSGSKENTFADSTSSSFKRDPGLSLLKEQPWRLTPAEVANHVSLEGLNSFCPADYQPYKGAQFKQFKLGTSFRAFKNAVWKENPAAIIPLMPNRPNEAMFESDVTYALAGLATEGNMLAPVRFVFALDHGVYRLYVITVKLRPSDLRAWISTFNLKYGDAKAYKQAALVWATGGSTMVLADDSGFTFTDLIIPSNLQKQ